MCYNEGMLTYNLSQLRNILQDLSTLADAPATLYDENYTSTSAHGVLATQCLCKNLKHHGFSSHCAKSDLDAFNGFPANQTYYYYHCHFGFIEIAFKLILNNKTQGYVVIGPFRDKELEKEQTERIRALCDKFGFDFNEQIKDYQKIAVFSKEKYTALCNLFFLLMNYAHQQNIIVSKNNFFTEKIEPYILDNLHEDLSNEHLQKTFFLSEKQLYSLFQACTNKTPKHYINEQRVSKARNLIISTDDSLAKISALVGFENYNYFIKVFKTYDGHTPMHYRKKKK